MSDQASNRNARRLIQGVVTSDKMANTITVTVERRFRHLKYQKYVRKHSKVYAVWQSLCSWCCYHSFECSHCKGVVL